MLTVSIARRHVAQPTKVQVSVRYLLYHLPRPSCTLFLTKHKALLPVPRVARAARACIAQHLIKSHAQRVFCLQNIPLQSRIWHCDDVKKFHKTVFVFLGSFFSPGPKERFRSDIQVGKSAEKRSRKKNSSYLRGSKKKMVLFFSIGFANF